MSGIGMALAGKTSTSHLAWLGGRPWTVDGPVGKRRLNSSYASRQGSAPASKGTKKAESRIVQWRQKAEAELFNGACGIRNRDLMLAKHT